MTKKTTMSEKEDKLTVDSDYYLDWHVISKAQSLLERAKTTIQFSKVKDETTQQDLKNDVQSVYQTLELLYPRE